MLYEDDVDIYYGDASPDLQIKVKMCIKILSSFNMDMVWCQGDLIFTE